LIIKEGKKTTAPYLKGYMLSEGCIKRDHEPLVIVYEPKFCCMDRLLKSASELPIISKNTTSVLELGFRYDEKKNIETMQGLTCRDDGDLFKWNDEYKEHLPEEVFAWDFESKCEFIAGVMDGDGNIVDNKGGFKYQLSSIRKEFLIDFLRLLKTVGVFGKISLMKKAQYKEIKGKMYWTQDCWRLTIPQAYCIKLSKVVNFSRLKSFSDRVMINEAKFKYMNVENITKLEGKHTVYCCNVLSNHSITTGEMVVTANCGELPLGPHGACLLGSINLAKMVVNAFTDDAHIDFELLKSVTYQAVKMLNRILDINRYPLEEQAKEAFDKRLIGLGITGLADMLAMLKIKYSSDDALSYAESVMCVIRDTSYRSSIDLAKIDGAFPLFDADKFLQSDFTKKLPDDIRDDIKSYGIRNGRIISVAPTGTISLLMNNVSSGIEPIFALNYERKVKNENGIQVPVNVEDYAWSLYKKISGNGNINQVPSFFETAMELDVDAHVRMQSLIQKYVDSSISKTVNVPKDYSFDDFSDVYWNAWKFGLKGCTTYRPNDVTGSVLEIKETNFEEDGTLDIEKRSNLEDERYVKTRAKISIDKLINILNSESLDDNLSDGEELSVNIRELYSTIKNYLKLSDGAAVEKELLDEERSRRHRVLWKDHEKVYINVTIDQEGYPLEVFSNLPKEAGINGNKKFNQELYLEKLSNWEAVSRLVSVCLRHGVPVEEVVRQLDKSTYTNSDVSGLFADILQKYPILDDLDEEEIEDDDCGFYEPSFSICPQCGEKSLFKKDQCEECVNCNYAKCNL